jgi:hypothetical protein
VPDIFDEVNEDLRAERMRRLLLRYGWLLVVAVVLVIAGTGFWQYWRYHQANLRNAVATSFMTAMSQASAPLDAKAPDRAEAMHTFATIAARGPSGYRTLARLQEAALQARAGDLPAALALWNQVSADEEADPQLRQLADLLWVQHQVDTGKPADVEGRLAPLIAPGDPWRPMALESQAWLKLRTGDKAGAIAILRGLVTLPDAPNGVRERANGLLVRLGAPPAAESQG